MTEKTIEQLKEENKQLRSQLERAQLEAENRKLKDLIYKTQLGEGYASPHTREPERDVLGNLKITSSTLSDEESTKCFEQALKYLFK